MDPVRQRTVRFLASRTRRGAVPVGLDADLKESVHKESVHIDEWNATRTPYPRNAPLHRLFEEQVRKTPNAPCVKDGTVTVTYRQLDRRANAVAWRLRESGVLTGDRVAVVARLSAGAVAAMLGVLKAGGVYVPLDPSYPAGRLADMCRQVGVRAIVADRTSPDLPASRRVPVPHTAEHERELPPAVDGVSASDPAYIMFTSGTTGRPKAVSVPHRSPARLVVASRALDVSETDTWLATTSMSFDVSCFEIFGALLNGARLVVLHRHTLLTPDALAHRIKAEEATVMVLSAGLFHEVVSWRPEMFAQLRYLFVTADVVSPASVRAVLRHGPPRHLVNAYGPTENGIFCTMHEITDLSDGQTSVPIGRPAANSLAYVVRPDGRQAAIGEQGELWVGGDGLAIGYHGDVERTSERFVDHRFPGAGGDVQRLYRTGDRARWRSDGTLEFFGRLDRQVKLNGYRIELAEVESTLTAHPEASEAVVDVRESPSGRAQLIAWAVPCARSGRRRSDGGERAVFARQLRMFVADHLPAFMVPSTVHVVDELPRNTNGKVDRRVLPTIPADTPSAGGPPATETEHIVAEVWAELLALPDLGRDDDFFARGGQSLQAARAVAMLQNRLVLPAAQTAPLIRALLASPTVGAFAQAIDETIGNRGPKDGDVDLWAEARLGPVPDFPPAISRSSSTPGQVLLTGATGFLGAFLLDRLLHLTDSTVHCLIRATDEPHARRRLTAAMRRFGLTTDDTWRRVIAVPGDLASPGLGLSVDGFDALARTVDTVVHSGAQVNFAYPYAALRPANVDGTRTLLRLATTHHLKPIHHVSTIDTVTGDGFLGQEQPPQDTRLQDPDRLRTGYAQSKWVAESLLLEAARHGLPLIVYRPCEISGASGRGTWPTGALVCALIKAAWDTGVAPDTPLPLNLVPVDHAADTFVHLLVNEPPRGQIRAIANSRLTDFRLIVDRLIARGRTVRHLPYADWLEEMTRRAAQHPDFPLTPFLPLFDAAADRLAGTTSPRGLSGAAPGEETPPSAAPSQGGQCPPIDGALIDRYLDYFEEIGFLTSHR
ncbi:amino acid adenylation domain-containing protein [Streptomyces arenae]|nr:amino acid adenylation domain-containing protein [Streptomyces arenae]